MNFTRIHTYLHAYDFPYYNYIKDKEEIILERIKINKLKNYLDSPLHIREFDEYLIPKIESIVNEYYIVTPPVERTTIRSYSQTNQSNVFFFHNHVEMVGNINVIFYINIPQEGGELEFITPVSDILKITPQKNKIYLMPQWLYHCPLPHKDNITRISFNWSYAGTNRPIHKLTGDLW